MHEPDYRYAARLVNVVDGDTVDLDVSLGFNVRKQIRVRLKGIDTAEIWGTDTESQEHKIGDRQAAYARSWLESQDHLVVETFQGETGKYGRYLARIWGEDENLSQALRNEFPDYFTE